MKLWLSFFSMGAILSGGPTALAAGDQDLAEQLQFRDSQIEKLQYEGGATCSQQFNRSFPGKTLTISLFHGYENFDEKTFDRAGAAATVAVLKRPCPGGIEICGFRQVSLQDHLTVLRRNIGGRTVTVKIYSSSISNNVTAHLDPKGQYWDQEKRSQLVRSHFYQDLNTSDAVFFLGHSRGGGGLGFNVSNATTLAFNFVFRLPVRPMLEALAQRPSRLKLLGLFGCETEKHYRAEVEKVAPHLSLLVSRGDVEFEEGPQAMLGALNALISQKCDNAFSRSLIGTDPDHTHMVYIRR